MEICTVNSGKWNNLEQLKKIKNVFIEYYKKKIN